MIIFSCTLFDQVVPYFHSCGYFGVKPDIHLRPLAASYPVETCIAIHCWKSKSTIKVWFNTLFTWKTIPVKNADRLLVSNPSNQNVTIDDPDDYSDQIWVVW